MVTNTLSMCGEVETQSELPVSVSEEPDVGRTQEPILADVSTQEPIVTEISTHVPIVEEVGTQKLSVEDVVLEDYVSSREDALRYKGGGQFTETIRRRPYVVIMFNETKKANVDVFNVFLQILDDGRLERVQKRVADRKLKIMVSEVAVELVGSLRYVPNYGARPMKRVIQEHVENELAKGNLRGDFKDEDTISLDTEVTSYFNGQLPQQKLVYKRVDIRHGMYM
ncbi:chaperone protein ClpB3, chloroplastic [Tanacetum coccineum]